MKRLFAAMTAALMMVALVSSTAFAGSTTWTLYSYNTAGTAFNTTPATVGTGGAVSFTFPVDQNVGAAYFITAKVGTNAKIPAPTLTATVSIAASSGTTFANYVSTNTTTCPGATGTSPTVGLYFSTGKPKAGTDPSSAYWWSSDRHLLTSIVGSSVLLSTSLADPPLWTNYSGTPGQTDPTGFAAAVKKITSWGVSFGGDCGYANGVGTPTGSAVFTLIP